MKIKLYYIIVLSAFWFTSLQAQSYLISFAGSGASTTVTTVKVENLTKGGTPLILNGTDILHLMGVTAIETVMYDATEKISFYPNPMKDYTRMQFDLPVSGETIITIYDLSGRKIMQTQDLLSKGSHSYGIQGMEEGIYFIRINSGKYSLSGRLMSSGSQSRNPKIVYENTENTMISPKKQKDSKGTDEEKVMQYTTSDRLKFTGISGNYSTVITDIPTASKSITFNFNACTDGNGNNYPIVKIGTQTWMAENLKATKYNDGTDILLIEGGTLWQATTTPAYCWYNNDATSNKDIYGALYNWYVVDAASNGGKNVCPTGWHVPSDVEWTALITSLGGESAAGGKLKETGFDHWISPNTSATNESGFTALPGGNRNTSNGSFSLHGNNGYWWSSLENSSTTAWAPYMSNTNSDVPQYGNDKKNGFSVRCIKDQPKVEEAFPGIDGEYQDFIINGDTITVEKINNKYVFQGDIFLTENQLNSGSDKGAGLGSFMKPWNCNTVHYKISDNLLHKQGEINAAIQHFEANTRLKFVERTDQTNYVEFVWDANGCASYLGMTGGRQEIWIDNGATTGTVIHEIGHAIGLIHEHSRADRDKYVFILYKNISLNREDADNNFGIINTQYKTSSFDFNSIMLYSSLAFSRNGLPTIIKIDLSPFEAKRVALSVDDIEVIKMIYPKAPDACVDIASTVTSLRCQYATVETIITTSCDLTITERGAYWGRYPNPELTGTKVQSGSGAGTYSVGFNDLFTGTTYFAKAYAITECDTVYGDEVNFTAPECCDTNPFQTGCNGCLSGVGSLVFEYTDSRNITLKYWMHIYAVFRLYDGEFATLPYLDIYASQYKNGQSTYTYYKEKMCDINGSCTDRWDCFSFSYGNHVFDFCLSDACFPPDCEGSVVVTGTWTIEEKKIVSSAVFPLKYSLLAPMHY